jgi:potassium-transporting ATPase KdpC subunit
MFKTILQATRATIVIAVLTGIVFPLVVTGLAQVLFPHQANGSLLKNANGQVIGSELIGQQFTQAKYFHPRPSAAGSGYAGEASAGSNLGPTSAKLFEGVADDPKTPADESFAGVKQLAQAYRKENGLGDSDKIPVDAVTRSASGLDPHISIANANMQAARVAKARNLPVVVIMSDVEKATEQRQFGFLGEPRVNVLILNISLDAKKE